MDPRGAELCKSVKQAPLDDVRKNIVGQEALALRDVRGRSLLFHAAMRGGPAMLAAAAASSSSSFVREPPQVAAEVCRHLVEVVGIDVDLAQPPQHLSQTALFYAARHGSPEVVSALLDLRAELDRRDDNAQTPLFYAAVGGNTPAVQLLCERKADAAHKDVQGQTALFFAVKPKAALPSAQAGCVRALFQAPLGGGSTLVRTVCPRLGGQTALFLAVRAGSLDVCVALLDGTPGAVDDVDVNEQTALFFAANGSRPDIVRLLLERSASATHKDRNGDTPLHYAARAAQVDTCKLLLIMGRADAYATNCEMSTPAGIVLGVGVHSRKPELVALFAGSDGLNTRKRRLPSVAQMVSTPKRAKRFDIVANVGTPGTALTPGSAGILGGRGRGRGRGGLRTSLVRGTDEESDVQSLTSSVVGATVIDWFPFSIAEGLPEPSENVQLGELARAAFQLGRKEVESLISSGHKPQEPGPFKRSLLFFAAMRQASDDFVAQEIIKLLVEQHGLEPNIADAAGQTPIFHAVRQGLSFATDALLEARADPRHEDAEGWTPLHFAAGLRMRGFPAGGLEMPRVTSVLLAARAAVNATGGRLHYTPLELAAAHGRVTTLELLLASGATFGRALALGTAQCVQPLVRGGCDPNAPLPLAGAMASPASCFQLPLFTAVAWGQVEKVQRLLEARADVGRSEEQSGHTALHHAALAVKGRSREEKKTLETILGVLLKDGAGDAARLDSQGKTAGDHAVKNRWFEGKRLLDGFLRERSRKESEALEEKARVLVEAMRSFETELSGGITVEQARQHLRNAGDDRKEWGALVSQQHRPQPKALLMHRGPGVSFAVQQRDGWRSRHPAPLLLHIAAARWPQAEHVEVCKLLVEEASFDAALRDRITGETALFRAASAGHADIVAFLLESRCDVNQTDAAGQTALCAAARAGSFASARALLQAGAAINTKDAGGRTALSYAAQRGADDVVRELVAHRAEVNAVNNSGQSVLFFAIRETRAQTAKLLLADFGAHPPGPLDPPLKADSDGNSDLFQMATERGLPEVVQLLHEAKKRQNEQAELVEVAATGAPERIAEMLARGLDVNAAGVGGARPLHKAAARIDGLALQSCRVLLEQQHVDVSVRDARSETALFAAARSGSEGCALALLGAGCDRDVVNTDGETALFAAVRHGQASIASMLLERGVQAGHTNRISQTPLFVAADSQCAALLLDRNCDVGATDARRRTAIFLACAAGRDEVVRLLLERGAQVDLVDLDGQSPLHVAVGGQIPRLLVAAKAAVDAEDTRNQATPLLCAVTRGDAAAVSALLWEGADARRCDAQRQTALTHAAKGASLEVVSALVRETLPADSSVLDRARNIAAAALRTASNDVERGLVVKYLSKVSKRYGEASRRKFAKAGLEMRRRFAFVYEEPSTKVRLPFGSPEYAAAIERLAEQCPWAFPASGVATTRGPGHLAGSATPIAASGGGPPGAS